MLSDFTLSFQTAAIDFDLLTTRLVQRANSKSPRIAVVGDYCLDKYLYIYPELDELSVETKLIASQVRATRLFPGVGGTIASNLCALGARTDCYGVVGEDGEGFDLLRALQRISANVEGMVVSDKIMTGAYMKPMRPAHKSTENASRLQAPSEGIWIESNRIDIRNPVPVPQELVEELKRKFLAKVSHYDAVVVSDQFPTGSEALFSDDFRKFLGDVARANSNVFFLCDSRFFINEYRDALVKCNANELFDAYEVAHGAQKRRETTLGQESESKTGELCRMGAWLAQRNGRPVLVTRGALGSILIEKEPTGSYRAVSIPAVPTEPPIDVCGAGDATNAGLVYAKALGFDLVESAYLAGVVSSITIKQIGVTGTASIARILQTLRSQKE